LLAIGEGSCFALPAAIAASRSGRRHRRRRPGLDALRVAWPWATRVMMLVGGDDTLTYETFARDILFNGI
jgi:hypothetical protein